MIGRVFLGRYEAVRLLGEGGMGKVYLARQLDLGRQVVIKVMHEHIAQEEKFRERFARETLLMANFQHPYAVTLYDASLNDPMGPCIIMEYIRGINLEALLQKNGRLSAGRVGRLLGQLCEVLQAAHSEGMIHRDLKPSNLMVVDHETPREKIKVMDFGLAKLTVESSTIKNVTESNFDFAVGTPGYICPEQVRGENVDHRGDLYSVGVMMYEMLTGRMPFIGPTGMDLMLAHATEKPPTFAELELDSLIPAAVEQVVFSVLEKDPKDRPQSARDLYEQYETALAIDEMGLPDDRAAQADHAPVALTINDPTTMTFQMEAWMPESIAIMKLRGYAHDMGGAVTDSVPGLIKLRLDPTAGVKNRSAGLMSLSWLGFGRRTGPIYLELYLHQIDQNKSNRLLIQAVFRPSSLNLLNDPVWRDRCTTLFIELRAYLMGQSEIIEPGSLTR
ncbi:MAG: serine/threonine protein kinase [Planctomycetes bacterium]|nr:serine/threonine protein kinase [Planctomycetota bacterium]